MLVYEAKIKYNTYVRIKKEKVKESKNLTLIQKSIKKIEERRYIGKQ